MQDLFFAYALQKSIFFLFFFLTEEIPLRAVSHGTIAFK